jgi:hypothetical protein
MFLLSFERSRSAAGGKLGCKRGIVNPVRWTLLLDS